MMCVKIKYIETPPIQEILVLKINLHRLHNYTDGKFISHSKFQAFTWIFFINHMFTNVC